MSRKAYVTGVGMVPFKKPSAAESYDIMAAKAIRAALKDAGLAYELIEQAYVGYVYGDSTCGQRALYHGYVPISCCGTRPVASNKQHWGVSSGYRSSNRRQPK